MAGINNYYVAVRKTAGTCTNDFRLLNEVTIEVKGNAVSTSSSDWSIKCGQNLTATLNGNVPPQGGSGVWTLSSTQHTTGSGVVIVSPNSPTTSVTGLNSGTYTFTLTVTSSCGSITTTATSSVTITVNCPSYYEMHLLNM
ncbi:hypothetical protein ABID22_002413 [Pontibacter aydingkolensis]|uniref:Ig-like domain-containing protein n=1 Tax=Pontibacter aydingkolensis TaxID=1911536 RepID=A0ABS7CVX2_9BACT|nr:hypothetical protein [Pontibacter aydingkolensis]MBW7468014.1 hypothetical protein [Pontibacter aydingkolensis]